MALAAKVEVTADDQLSEMQSHVSIKAGGVEYVASHDLAAPMALVTRTDKLMKKANGLVGTDKAKALWNACNSEDLHDFTTLLK
jgi:hypothetical protein